MINSILMKPRILTILILSLVLGLPAAPAMADDAIAMLRPDGSVYTLQGEVITIWYDTFLLDDGTGEVTVTIAPHTATEMHLAGGQSVMVTGSLQAGAFKPLVLVNGSTGKSYLFDSPQSALPPVPEAELKQNDRYRIKRR